MVPVLKAAFTLAMPVEKAVVMWHGALSLSDLRGLYTTCHYQFLPWQLRAPNGPPGLPKQSADRYECRWFGATGHLCEDVPYVYPVISRVKTSAECSQSHPKQRKKCFFIKATYVTKLKPKCGGKKQVTYAPLSLIPFAQGWTASTHSGIDCMIYRIGLQPLSLAAFN